MKSFLEKSKRSLALLLTAGMVLTSLPMDVLAAPADEIIEEEVVEASEDVAESLTAGEEVLEEASGEDSIDPDASYNDVTYYVLQASSSNSGVFDVAAEDATASKIITAITDPATTAPVSGQDKKMDSVNGATVYVAPVTGYEITSANLADAIQVVGEYKANDDDTDGIAIPATAYSIAPTDKPYVKASGYDFTRAYSVTINGGSEWLNAYRTAEIKNGATADDPRISKALRVVVDDSKFTVRKATADVNGEEANHEIEDLSIGYFDDNEDPFALNAAVSATNWDKKSVKVAFTKAGSEDIEFALAASYSDTTDGKCMTNAHDDLAYFVDGSNNVYFSVTAIHALFDEESEYAGYQLTVTIADKTEDDKIHVAAETDSLVTFTGLSAVADGTTEKNATAKYDKVISATAGSNLNATAGIMYPFKAEVTGTTATTGRKITEVYYAIGDADPVPAAELDVVNDEYGTTTTHYLYNGNTGTTFTGQTATADGGYWAIPAAAITSAAEGETITLSADTKELVTINLSQTESHGSYVKYADGELTTVNAGANVTVAPLSYVETGEDYVFTALAANNRVITSVTAKMTQPGGTGGGTVAVKPGDGGQYTVENVTGKLSVYVETEAVSAANTWEVALTANLGSHGEVADVATGDVITTSSKGKAYTGKDFTFKVTPSDDKIISKVEYVMGGGAKTELTKSATRSTVDGISYYTIPSVSGTIDITVTEVDAARITKTANVDTTVTITDPVLGSVELNDGATALVKAQEAFSFTVAAKNGAQIEGVYYASLPTGTTVTDANKGEEMSGTNGTYKIGKDLIVKNTSNNINITVVTSREADAGYTVDFTSTHRPDSNSNPANKFTSLALKGGGITSSVNDGESSVQVVAVVTDANGNSVTAGTHAWALSDTSESKKVAGIGSPTASTTWIDSTDLPGENTITYKQIVGFPNGYRYEGSFPVTVVPMSELYTNLEFSLDATVAGSISTITSEALENCKSIRLDDTTLVDDSMAYSITATVIDFTGEETEIKFGANLDSKNRDDIGSTSNIASVAWTVTPSYEPTLKVKPYNVSDLTGPTTTISAATEAKVLNVSAKVTFIDGSEATIGDTLNLIDVDYGYLAVPVITMGGNSAPSTTASLETKQNGANTASITWRVFDLVDGANVAADWYTTTTKIATELDEGDIEEVPTTDIVWDAPSIVGNTDDAYATISGTNTVTVAAKKATPYFVAITPNATVSGIPVMGIGYGAVIVNIYNELDVYSVDVYTADDAQESLASEYTLGFAYPQMTSGLASLSPISKFAKTLDADPTKEKYTGFQLTSIADGSILTLPAQSAFDSTTIDPKKVLAGWAVRVDNNADGKIDSSDAAAVYYKADGTETITISQLTEIHAIWAYKYESGPANPGDGHVALYKIVGDADPVPMGSTLDVANGSTVEAVIGYYPIDLTKAPTSSGAVYDESKLIYGEAAGGTLTITESDPAKQTVSVTGNKIKGSVTSKGETLAVKWVDADGCEYSTYNPYVLKVATDGMIAPTITANCVTATTYSIEVADFSGLEVGQTKTIGLTVNDTTSGTPEEKTKRNQFASVEWKVTPEDAVDVNWVVKDPADTDSIKSFTITGKKATTATLQLTLVDADGNTATLEQPLSVAVTTGSTLEVSLINALTEATGEVVAPDTEMNVLVAGANTISLALVEADGEKPATSSANWEIEASDTASVDAGDDVSAWTTASISVATDKTATITPVTDLGVKSLTVRYYTDKTVGNETYYTREIPVRSFYAVAVAGPKDATESANYSVTKANTPIAEGKTSIIKVPYVDGNKDSADEFTASLEGYSAKYIGTTAKKIEFKGWSYQNSGIVENGANKDFAVDTVIALTNSGWNAIDTAGIATLYAVFGAEATKLSGLPTEIVLSDEKLSTADKSVNGTDRAYIQIGVTPKDATEDISLEANDADKIVLVDAVDKYPKSGTAGYVFATESASTSTVWDGNEITLTHNPSGAASSRTDVFTIAKLSDADRAYVGLTTITVSLDSEEYATIPVYLNGEYTDATGTHYMERGEILEVGSKTVKGEIHYYKDSKLVTDGVVDVEGGKILIISNAQVTTVGDAMYNGNHYYVGKDGFLKIGKFVGEGTSDANVTYYADEDAVLAVDKFVTIGSDLFYFSATAPTGHMLTGTGDAFVTLTDVSEGNWKGTFDYVVGTDGKVLTASPVTIGEKTYYVNSYGQKVTYADATEETGTDPDGKKYGKYTDPVTNQKWVIYEDGSAKMDDILYAPVVTWTTQWPASYTKKNPYPEMKYTISYTSKNGNPVVPKEGVATVTSEPATLADDATEVTFTATADLTGFFADSEGKTPATAEPLTRKYIFKDGGAEGLAKEYTYKSHKFTWVTRELGTLTKPEVTATVTYDVVSEGNKSSETLDAIVTVSEATVEGNYKVFTASLTTIDGLTKTESKKYNATSGKFGGEGIAIEGLEEEYPFTGKAIKPAFTVVDYEADKVLVEKTDYTVKFADNTKLGTATITIKGKGNYDKQAITATFAIVDPLKDEDITTYVQSVKKVKASKDNYVYDGTAKYPTSLQITTNDGAITATLNTSGDGYDLPDGKNVMITVSQNVNKGSGVVSVTGADKVTKSATFAIKPADISTLGDALEIVPEAAAYTKAGAKAAVTATFNSEELVAGRDFTLVWTYSNKKNAGLAAGSVKLKGKNNFKGTTAPVSFDIEKLALSEENIIVDAFAGTKVKSIKAKVFDGNGDEIAKKSYSITKVEKDGEALDSAYKLVAGDEITVTVKGDGVNVEDTEVNVDIKVGEKLAKAKFTTSLTKTYTGEPIEIDDEDLEKITASVKINKVATTLVAGEDYEVVGYKNNNKAGKMTVYVRGIGDKVSGFGKFTIKVNAKVMKKAE